MSKNIINTNHIIDVEITFSNETVSTSEPLTKINLYNNKPNFIVIDGDHKKHQDIIELTIQNYLENKKFVSINKLKESIIERIKSAEKSEENYQNRG